MKKYIFLIFLLFVHFNLMAYEDFTDPAWIELDDNNRFTITADKIDVSGLTMNEDAWVVKDKGVDHFDGDFEHLVEVYEASASDNNCQVGVCVLSNAIDDVQTLKAGDALLAINFSQFQSLPIIYIWEVDGGNLYQDFKTYLSFDTPYYLKLKRDEDVGDYGTYYCYIYDDAERTSLVDTLTLAVHTSKKDFRYIFGANSVNASTGYTFTGYIQNLDLQEPLPPPVFLPQRRSFVIGN